MPDADQTIADIDAALEEWETGPDAMRWSSGDEPGKETPRAVSEWPTEFRLAGMLHPSALAHAASHEATLARFRTIVKATLGPESIDAAEDELRRRYRESIHPIDYSADRLIEDIQLGRWPERGTT